MAKIPDKLIKVFVYGTLKRGEPNHHWLTAVQNGYSKFMGKGKTAEKFPLVIGTRYNIPFLLDKRGEGHNVQGEVYAVDDMMFGKLDELEDHPRYYDREMQPVIMENNETVMCWLYLIRKFPERLLQKRHLASYTNTEEQKYHIRSERTSDVPAMEDMAY